MTGLPAFLGIWLVMMAAMMAPSVYPTVRLFATARASRAAFGVRPAPVSTFVAGYLAVWTGFGIPVYIVVTGVPMGMFSAAERGLALIIAGIYQLTPWQSACLGHCRSPALFLLHAWRDGPVGAFLMGTHHGAYCVGCCWGLMLVLTALGVMNVGWMAAVAAAIFVEKVMRGGARFGRVLGVLLLAGGAAVALGLIPSSPMTF